MMMVMMVVAVIMIVVMIIIMATMHSDGDDNIYQSTAASILYCTTLTVKHMSSTSRDQCSQLECACWDSYRISYL